MRKTIFLALSFLATTTLAAGGDGPDNSTLNRETTCVVSNSFKTYKKDLIIVYKYKQVNTPYSYNPQYSGTMDIKIAAGDSAKAYPLNYRLLLDAKNIPFHTLADTQELALSGPWALHTDKQTSRFAIYGLGRSLDYWHQERSGEVTRVVEFRNGDAGRCATK